MQNKRDFILAYSIDMTILNVFHSKNKIDWGKAMKNYIEEEKILDNVEPLNGYRVDCYRQALLPAIIHCGRDIRPFLLANVGHFEYDKTFSFSEIPMLNYDTALKNLGIDQQYLYTTKNNFIENICESINKNKIVIAYVDTFSYNRFPALYSNTHSRHGILIYGYNIINQTFYIIDSNFIENFEREKAEISFDDLLIAHNEMIEHYKIQNFIELISPLDQYNENYTLAYISKYLEFIKRNPNIFNNSIQSLNNYAIYFKNLFDEKEKIIRTASPIYTSFNRAINLRHLEYVAYRNVFENVENILECLDEMIGLYNYVRAVMYKSLYTQEYRDQSFRKCSKLIDKIIELEKLYYKLQCEDILIENIR